MSSTISSIRQNDNIISGSNEIAETFNEYFSTIGDKIANSLDSGILDKWILTLVHT
jgi:propanediol dehydratase large subunit